jgi:glycine dehydrogenase
VPARRLGADVCHLNLHKTFCIPHGGGGPGHGPDRRDRAPRAVPARAPGGPIDRGTEHGDRPGVGGAVREPSILPIVDVHRDDGREGLTRATEVAILNANYMAKRLGGHYDVLFKGANGPGRARVHHRLPPVQEDRRGSRSTTSPSG